MAGEQRWRQESIWIGVAAAVVALAAGGGYLAWRHYARPVDPRYEQVIAALSGDPAAAPLDGRGRYVLTGGPFAGLTPRDEVFVARRPDRSMAVLFPTTYGNGASLAGLLYTSRPFAPGDTYDRQPTMGTMQTLIDVGSYRHLLLDDRIDDHWYHVSYAMR